jgi:hypothetical protein
VLTSRVGIAPTIKQAAQTCVLGLAGAFECKRKNISHVCLGRHIELKAQMHDCLSNLRTNAGSRQPMQSATPARPLRRPW